MPLVLQMQLVMMSRYSKIQIDTFKTLKYWATLLFLHNENNDDDLVITVMIARLFLRNRQI